MDRVEVCIKGEERAQLGKDPTARINKNKLEAIVQWNGDNSDVVGTKLLEGRGVRWTTVAIVLLFQVTFNFYCYNFLFI